MQGATATPTTKSETITVEDLCMIANSFTEQGQFEKAVSIYETACRLFPDNLALKINLGRVRSLRSQQLESPADILRSEGAVSAESQQDPWIYRFQGLGEIFLTNGRRDLAQQVFELSKASDPKSFLPALNLGRLFLQQGEFARAVVELEEARRLNPFSEEICDLLATARFEHRDFKEALTAAVDALIVSGELSRPKGGRFGKRIKEIMTKIPGFTAQMRNDLIHQRRNRINAAYEELEADLREVQTERDVYTGQEASEAAPASPQAAEEEKRRLYDTALQLKKHLIFRNMEDEAVLKVARFTSELRVLQGDYVYQEGDPVYGLYLVNRGKVEIQRSTPYGPIVFAAIGKGGFFGDDNLLSGRTRVSNAAAVQETDVLFIDKAGLANIFARERAIAIHFLWYFWKSLSFQIREANDRMTSFFAAASEKGKRESPRSLPAKGSEPPATPLEVGRKLEVLRTKGLSGEELKLLVRLSNEEKYNQGETIFREGDPGDRLYIVLEGSVRIAKSIPGVGDEALALLKKGDFFGEMSLANPDHRRSADARAQEQGTSLLVVTKNALREILSIDTDSAYRFLTILCRILSQRLLEMNEKIYQWRMMAGSF